MPLTHISKIAYKAVVDAIDDVASDGSISRAEYRELLEEISCDVEGRLDGLNEDDARDEDDRR